MEDGFGYPTDKKIIPDLTETYTVLNKLEYGDEMLKVQEAFLSMDMDESGDDDVGDVSGNTVNVCCLNLLRYQHVKNRMYSRAYKVFKNHVAHITIHLTSHYQHLSLTDHHQHTVCAYRSCFSSTSDILLFHLSF
jgi:hypothetical protein